MRVQRFPNNPIIVPHMDGRMGDNINGPSLLAVPDWISDPMGRYYLYFAHHHGTCIRLAFADRLEGPWKTYEPGVLDLADTPFRGHIASPDVHIDPARRELRMYFHGPSGQGQQTRLAVSRDGRHFTCLPEVLGVAYFRVWSYRGHYYAVDRAGRISRSADGLKDFEPGPSPFPPGYRHGALKLDGDMLTVFYSCIGDRPEHIVYSQVTLGGDWRQWRAPPPVSLLKPELDYEGTDLPLECSRGGWAPQRVCQLRDPAIFREDGRTYLLYSVAGEAGIAIGELLED